MSTEKVIANTLRIAFADLSGAKLLAAADNRNAPYLCEQAAEKLIRAVLTSEGIPAGTGHMLAEMVKKLPDANPVKPALAALADLAGYATAYRYSTSSRIPPSPSARELAEDLARVESALNDIAARFGVELDLPNAPARNPEPFR